MLKRLLSIAIFLALSVIAVPALSASASPSPPVVAATSLTYLTTGVAQAHCSRDVVVWLNIFSGIYHYKGERWYGRTKHREYVCEKEAIAAGDRASRNGQ